MQLETTASFFYALKIHTKEITMNKKLFTVLLSSLLSFTQAANAESPQSTLDFLKKTPATKYEVGKLQMEFLAFLMNRRVKDEKLDGTNFRFRSVKVDEQPNALNLLAQMEGKAKYISETQCRNIKSTLGNNKGIRSMSSELWPDLSTSQKRELESVIGVSVQLISRENESFTVSC